MPAAGKEPRRATQTAGGRGRERRCSRCPAWPAPARATAVTGAPAPSRRWWPAASTTRAASRSGPDGALYVTEAGLGGPTCLPIPTAEGDAELLRRRQAPSRASGTATRSASSRACRRSPTRRTAPPRPARRTSPSTAGAARRPSSSASAATRTGAQRPRTAPRTRRWPSSAGAAGCARSPTSAAFEADSNPAGGTEDSNPFSVVDGRHGTRYVSDAGGNSILKVRRRRDLRHRRRSRTPWSTRRRSSACRRARRSRCRPSPPAWCAGPTARSTSAS